MKIAIYSRKSKFTEKGDSVENQVQMCKDYINSHFAGAEIVVYEDEGFSGGHTDRPQFKLLIRDAKAKKFNALICYRLDRISRNVADFSILLDNLDKYGISFISIREQFDTSTPMGRAMLYIASVFAQLERETIAERIRDNMIQLAKTGRWLGGTTPTGFASEEVAITDTTGKQRKLFKLVPIEEEIATVKLIFNQFLKLRSLSQVETYLIQQDIKSKNNISYSRHTIRSILMNPVYAIADETIYNYLDINNFDVYSPKSDFDGTRGLMAYNKTIQKKNKANKLRDNSEWIISIGAHEGIIPGVNWVEAQEIIIENKDRTLRKPRNQDALLSGLLKCSHCGSYMRPKMGRVDKNGNKLFYYLCELKEKSKGQKCNVKNAHGIKLDQIVIEEIKHLHENESAFKRYIEAEKSNLNSETEALENQLEIMTSKIKANDEAIANLVGTLAASAGTAAHKYIVEQINAIDQETAQLKNSLLELSKQADTKEVKTNEFEIVYEIINNFVADVDHSDIFQNRNKLKTIVDNITWDGENVDINLFGSKCINK